MGGLAIDWGEFVGFLGLGEEEDFWFVIFVAGVVFFLLLDCFQQGLLRRRGTTDESGFGM